MFKRSIYGILKERLSQPRRFIQVLAGPRQTGKTTLARQIMAGMKIPSHYASADEPALKDRTWLEQQWEVARVKTRAGDQARKTLLALDEIQKIPSNHPWGWHGHFRDLLSYEERPDPDHKYYEQSLVNCPS